MESQGVRSNGVALYDAVVVGCGPAGSTAGYLLASSGLSVAMVDRAKFPRPKLCGGLLPEKTLIAVERIFGVARDDLAGRGVIDHVSYGYSIYFRGKPIAHGATRKAFYHADRQLYDAFLLEMAATAGAHVYEGDAAIGLDPPRGMVETKSGRRLYGRFVVGADGALGITRRYLRTPSRCRRIGPRDAVALETLIPWERLARTPEVPEIILGFVQWGYGWVFPTGRGVLAGLGGLRHRNERNFKDALFDMIEGIGLADPQGLEVLGHPIPFGRIHTSPVEGRLLLVGDAAGYADPITGEGVFHAHRSAEAACRAVMYVTRYGGSLGERYSALLRRHVVPLLAGARRFQPVAYVALNALPSFVSKAIVRRFHPNALKVINGQASYPLSAGTSVEDVYRPIPRE